MDKFLGSQLFALGLTAAWLPHSVYKCEIRGTGLLFSVNSHSRSVPTPTPNITNPCHIICNIVCSFVVTTQMGHTALGLFRNCKCPIEYNHCFYQLQVQICGLSIYIEIIIQTSLQQYQIYSRSHCLVEANYNRTSND